MYRLQRFKKFYRLKGLLPSRGVANSPSFLLNIQKPSGLVGESLTRRVGESPTCRVGESFFDYEYLRKFEAKIIGVLCTTEENLSVSMCVKKIQYY
jgi:hypothetical protein